MALNYAMDDFDFTAEAQALLADFDALDDDERGEIPNCQDDSFEIAFEIDDNGNVTLGHYDGTWGLGDRDTLADDIAATVEYALDYDREQNPEDYEDEDEAA